MGGTAELPGKALAQELIGEEPGGNRRRADRGGHRERPERSARRARAYEADRPAVDARADVLLHLWRLGPRAGDERLPALGQIPVLKADRRRIDARDAVSRCADPARRHRPAERGVSPALRPVCASIRRWRITCSRCATSRPTRIRSASPHSTSAPRSSSSAGWRTWRRRRPILTSAPSSTARRSKTAATSIWAGASSRNLSRSRSTPSCAAGPARSRGATTAAFCTSSPISCSTAQTPAPPMPRVTVTGLRGTGMASLKIDHERCTECRMCYIVCREIDLNAVYVALEPLHRIEIDIDEMHLSRLHRVPDVLPGGRARSSKPRPAARWSRPARSVAS